MSRRSAAGLDWLAFFVANAQTGFGPFIAVYLTQSAWTQTSIGEVLSIGTFAAMASQVPGGALVDRLRDKRLAALVASLGVATAAMLFALSPAKPSILLAVLHSLASSMLNPAIVAISLALVGYAGLGARLGRNTRFAALGNGIAAGVLGVFGAYLSGAAVFWLTCGLMIPALVAISRIRDSDLKPRVPAPADHAAWQEWRRLLLDRRLLVFSACAALFFFNDAALLPLAATHVTKMNGQLANLVIAASIVLPQFISAAISPWVGRSADRWGRRWVLILGFAAVPLRGLLLSVSANAGMVIFVQALDGISAAVFGVTMPLVVADITRGTRHFNAMVGVIGLVISGGAALSTLVGGIVADQFSHGAVFLVLAAGGAAGVLLLVVAMPETRMSPEATGSLAQDSAVLLPVHD